jgi:hypothetical protein
VVVGAVPAVLIGSLLSSRVSDRFLRPAIFLVILASGVKYVGAGTDLLATVVGAVALLMVVEAEIRRRRKTLALRAPAAVSRGRGVAPTAMAQDA